MDKRKKYIIVIDTETCPLDREMQTVNPYNMFVYDIGFAVVDKRGNVYETRSYVVSDIFYGEKELMKSAYYANKLPAYYEDIKAGRREVATFYEIRSELSRLMIMYNTNTISAHNARFDCGALNNTIRWTTKSNRRYFFHYGLEIWDTMKMANCVVAKTPTYVNFCKANGYMTKNGRPQVKAEILYRYITGDNDFIESHTGLEDVLIEKEIMAYCFRKHKKMRKKLYEQGLTNDPIHDIINLQRTKESEE